MTEFMLIACAISTLGILIFAIYLIFDGILSYFDSILFRKKFELMDLCIKDIIRNGFVYRD